MDFCAAYGGIEYQTVRLDWKEEKSTWRYFFQFYATARGGAKEARLRASLDSRQPEGVPSGHPDKVQRKAADYTTNLSPAQAGS